MESTPGSTWSRRRLLGAAAGAALAVGLTPDTAAAVPLSGVSATVNVATLNVRSGAGTSYPIVGKLSQGTRVSCVATSGSWFKVTTSSLTGYVYSPYVTLIAASPATTISRGPTTAARVALTFDAGADRGYTASILDTLAAKEVKASFGLTGNWCAKNGDLVRRIAAEGHHFINHTKTHRSFTGVSTRSAALTPAQRLGEIEATERRLVKLTGAGAKPWFRPPYGDYDASVLRDIAADGFRSNVMWTLDSLGWKGLSRDQIVSRVLNSHGNGYIYLFHVGADSQDGPALARIIDGLRSRGYRFVTVPRLLR